MRENTEQAKPSDEKMAAFLSVGDEHCEQGNIDEGVKHYHAAAEHYQENPDAVQEDGGVHLRLGDHYANKKDDKNAAYYYGFAFAAGDSKAQDKLESLYENKRTEDKKTIEELLKIYDEGYAYGEKKNYLAAITCYEKAAEYGLIKAQNALGVYYGNGQGVERNYKKTVEYYRTIVARKIGGYDLFLLSELPQDLNDIPLGRIYLEKQGNRLNYIVKKPTNEIAKDGFDFKVAGELTSDILIAHKAAILEEISKKGDIKIDAHQKADAASVITTYHNIGVCYENGQGVKQSSKIAARYYRLGSEAGNFRSQNNLAHLYENGLGVEKDLEKAASYFERAAAQNYYRALYNIGTFYENGKGTYKKDINKAIEYYELATKFTPKGTEFNYPKERIAKLRAQITVSDEASPLVTFSNIFKNPEVPKSSEQEQGKKVNDITLTPNT